MALVSKLWYIGVTCYDWLICCFDDGLFFFWFVYCFIRLVVIVLTGSFVIIAPCLDCYLGKILHFEISCVGVRYCKILLFEKLFTEDGVIFEYCVISKTVLLWETLLFEN